jgi:SAM-dependent methyltransferase
VDVEPGALARLREKAAGRGLDRRVRALAHDLDGGWPGLGPLDLTWASMSLHHLADPGRVLADALAATRPGGVIAVAEFAQPLRFLPDDLGFGEPGVEDRIAGLLTRAHAEELPTLGSAWAPRLADAGWTVTGERDFPIDLDPPAHPRAAEYARAWFTRLAEGFTDRLAPGDQATLAELLADGGPSHGVTLHIRGTRTVTLARRPSLPV